MRRRQAIGPALVVAAVVVALVVALAPGSGSHGASPSPGTAAGSQAPGQGGTDAATAGPTTRPFPGHELFGFVPYWEMNDGIASHLAKTPLTTLALFSVTHTKTGRIDTAQTGYKRITGAIGTQLIKEAHDRHVAVQLVYSSFGAARNQRFFGSATVPDAAISALVDLAETTGVDGIDVDVEQLPTELIPAYGGFGGRLRDALQAKLPKAVVSVATAAGGTGAAMALAASQAGADRIFLMGYDYHYAASEPGASAPMDRRDGGTADLVSSLDLYDSVGVPVEKMILGLPLYGMRWRVAGPWLGAPSEGNGAIWVPADNRAFLTDPPTPPETDPVEIVEFYAIPPPGAGSPPTASNGDDPLAPSGWQAIYVDSPATLEPKLSLADDRGLAGAGFW